MIFIGGITPRIKRLDNNPRPCPGCGQLGAGLKRIDHYLSIFFVPVLRVKKGAPFVLCDTCWKATPRHGEDRTGGTQRSKARCRNCGGALQIDFQFCPFCGKPLQA